MALKDRVFVHPITWALHQKVQNHIYRDISRRTGAEDVVFFNWACEQDPPMALPLEASDEPNRYCIQLYPARRPRRISAANGCWRSVVATAAEPHTSCAPCTRPPTRAGLEPERYRLLPKKAQSGWPGVRSRRRRGPALRRPNLRRGDQCSNPHTATLSFPVSSPKWSACCAREGISCTGISDPAETVLPPGRRTSANAPMRMLSQREINAELTRGMGLARDRSPRAGIPANKLAGTVVTVDGGNGGKDPAKRGSIRCRMYCFAKA